MQKLSAIRYIIHHKRKVAVLVATLALSFYLMFGMSYSLLKKEKIIHDSFMDMSDRVQLVQIGVGAFDNTDCRNIIEKRKILKKNKPNYENLVQRLKDAPEAEDAFLSSVLNLKLCIKLIDYDYYVPLVSTDNVNTLAERFDTGISEGKMPDTPGEIAVSRNFLLVMEKKVGDKFSEYDKDYKISGVVDFDGYIAFGCKYDDDLNYSNDDLNYSILILSDIDDVEPLLERNGITDRKDIKVLEDHKTCSMFLKERIKKINAFSNFINYFVIIVSAIVLVIVYLQYLNDRYSEWCLYYSLGFSVHEIYRTVTHELLLTFIAGLLLGRILTMFEWFFELKNETGYYPVIQSVMKTLSVFVLIFGLFQIAVRYILKKIKTVDAVNDELY